MLKNNYINSIMCEEEYVQINTINGRKKEELYLLK